MDVDSVDDDAAVRAGAVIVQVGRDPARERERDEEPKAGEHRPLATRTQVMMEMESLLDVLHNKLFSALQPSGHCPDRSAPRRRLPYRVRRCQSGFPVDVSLGT